MTLSYKEVAEIIKIIDASDCEELVLELEGFRLVIRRSGASGAGIVPASKQTNVIHVQKAQDAQGSQLATPAAPSPAAETGDMDGVTVYSPMAGTFYRSPSLGEEPFVEKGTKVTADDPLCLIEVMKLYTTIETTTDGVVEAILAEDGKLVEFDQPLFVIRTD